jgi:hypothetical protein
MEVFKARPGGFRRRRCVVVLPGWWLLEAQYPPVKARGTAMLYAQSDHGIDEGGPCRILIKHRRWWQGIEFGELGLADYLQQRMAVVPKKP